MSEGSVSDDAHGSDPDCDGWDPHDLAVDTGGGRLDETEPSPSRPLVTAVVTTYDRFEEATRAIESVLQQTYEPIEFIIVEDGTESGVEQWLIDQGHDSVRYVCHATNQGLSAGRNTAIALASGKYIAFLDDDDSWKPERIERQIEVVRSSSRPELERLGVVYCAVEARENGKVASIILPENSGNLRQSIMRNGPSTLQSSCLFPKQVLVNVGGYDELLPSSIDHDIWLSLATHDYDAKTISEPLVITYNSFADSMMTNTDNRIEGVTQFTEKWRSTYVDWFGPQEGERRLQQYFARVIGRLVATKLVSGRFREAKQALSELFNRSDQTIYNIMVLSALIGEASIKRFLPAPVIRRLSVLRN